MSNAGEKNKERRNSVKSVYREYFRAECAVFSPHYTNFKKAQKPQSKVLQMTDDGWFQIGDISGVSSDV